MSQFPSDSSLTCFNNSKSYWCYCLVLRLHWFVTPWLISYALPSLSRLPMDTSFYLMSCVGVRTSASMSRCIPSEFLVPNSPCSWNVTCCEVEISEPGPCGPPHIVRSGCVWGAALSIHQTRTPDMGATGNPVWAVFIGTKFPCSTWCRFFIFKCDFKKILQPLQPLSRVSQA